MSEPLHPLAIPAIPAGKVFKCRGEGLLYQGIERARRHRLKDLLDPFNPSMCSPIDTSENSKAWWKAQCFHYGIKVRPNENKDYYRECLEVSLRQVGGLKRPQGLIDLELEYNALFRRMNADIRNLVIKSRKLQSESQSASINPENENEAGLHLVSPSAEVIELKASHAKKRKTNNTERDDNIQAASIAEGIKRPAKQPRTAMIPAQDDGFGFPGLPPPRPLDSRRRMLDLYEGNKKEARQLIPVPSTNIASQNASVAMPTSTGRWFEKTFMVLVLGIKFILRYRSSERQSSYGRSAIQHLQGEIQTPLGAVGLMWLSGTVEQVETDRDRYSFGWQAYGAHT